MGNRILAYPLIYIISDDDVSESPTRTALTGALCLFFANCGRRNGETDHDSDVYMYGSHVSPPKYTPSIGEFKRTEYI